jgi:hypothetical protein
VAFVHQQDAVAAARRGDRGPASSGATADNKGFDVDVPVDGLCGRDLRRIVKPPTSANPICDEPID